MNTKKKVRLILLTFVLVLTISNVFTNNVSAAPTQVIHTTAGTGAASTTTTCTPAYPAVQTGDLLLCAIMINVATRTVSSVTGFTVLYQDLAINAGEEAFLYYKYATGSESGTVTVTRTAGTAGMGARIYGFRNVHQTIGSAIEGYSFADLGSVSTIVDTGVTTTGTLELAINIVYNADDANTPVSFTSETGGDWTEQQAEYEWASGNDGSLQLQCATMATAGTVNGGSASFGGPDACGVLGFALKPEDSGGEEYQVNKYDGITVSGTEYFIVDYVTRYYDSIQNSAQAYPIVDYVLGFYDNIIVASNTVYSLVVSKAIFEAFTVVSNALLSVDFTLILSDVVAISSSVILTVSFIIQLFESFAIVSSITVSLIVPELIHLFETISIFSAITVNKIVPTIVSLFESIGIYDTTSWYAGVVSFVNIAQEILVNLQNVGVDAMIADIFYSLFLSTNMWGYFGPLALVIIGYYVTKKEKGLGIFWIIVDSLVIATYLSLVEASPGYWWHILILILGVIQCTFRLVSR